MERKIIDSIIGRTIKEMRVMTFYLNRESICGLISLYIKVDTGFWYRFTTCDGENIIELLQDEPLEINLEEIEDEFAYPIQKIDSHWIDNKIEDVKSYIYRNFDDELNGFYFRLDTNDGFSLFEKDDGLKIYQGLIQEEGYSLV